MSIDDMPESLKKQVRFGLEALRDPEMERRVHEHLTALGESPRNLVHAAMIAARFRREAIGATTNGTASEPTDRVQPQKTADTTALQVALGAGIRAMENPVVEAAVEAYFANNPDYSRDPVHVAAIACQFAELEKQTSTGRSPGLRA